MKKNELMIDDWVQINGRYAQVLEMHYSYAMLDFYEDVFYMGYLEPIPLTEEILKVNGFVTNNDHTLTGSQIYHRLCGKYEEYKVTVRLLNGWVKIESFDDRWYTLLDLSVQPRYVHELQHVLRLCGLNDLANNFKVE